MNKNRTTLALMVALGSSYAVADELPKGAMTIESRLEALEKQVQGQAPRLTKVDGGVRAASADGQFTWRAFGRMHADVALYDKDVKEMGSGTIMRRARLGMRGTVMKDWAYKWEVDFGLGTTRLADFYVGYQGIPDTMIYIGNTSEFFSFEEYSTSNTMMFMERSFGVDALALDRGVGIGVQKWAHSWTANAGVFGDHGSDAQPPANSTATTEGSDEGLGTSARGTWAPRHEAGDILHVGGSITWRDPAGGTHRVRARPDSRVTDVRLVDTGSLTNVKSYGNLGLEFAWVGGPLTVQAEYVRQEVTRDVGADLSFDGGYVSVAYMLTGEKRIYYHQYGVFDGISPADKKKGSWELAARYDMLNLDDGAVKGGEQQALTLGLNHYVNYNLRFMLNAIQVQSEKGGVDDDPRILQARAALYF